jgi:hypothetical protein
MSETLNTNAWLSISARGKGIPYPGSAQYEEGSTHYGFEPLKGRPAEAKAIHEVQDDPALRDAIVALNDAATGVFTVGCEKSFNHDEEGHWAKGYIEFAINDKALVVDAQNYFKIFFVFNQFLREQQFDSPVGFQWVLEPAGFIDAGIDGFSASVWITVYPQPEPECVREIWREALSILAAFLCDGTPRPDADPLY